MGGTPSKPGDPSRGLEVIGAGFSRTGTVSMQLALEKILDGPVIHGGTHMISREDGTLFLPFSLRLRPAFFPSVPRFPFGSRVLTARV